MSTSQYSTFTVTPFRDLAPPRMMLHAHRLILSSALENLDLNAGDPFLLEEEWIEGDEICPLLTAYTAIYDSTLEWEENSDLSDVLKTL